MSDEVVKCAKTEEDDCTFCPQMMNVVQITNDRRKGLVPVEVTNFKTGAKRLIGVCYKTGPSDKGVMLNQCPWCGADLQWWEKEGAAP